MTKEAKTALIAIIATSLLHYRNTITLEPCLDISPKPPASGESLKAYNEDRTLRFFTNGILGAIQEWMAIFEVEKNVSN